MTADPVLSTVATVGGRIVRVTVPGYAVPGTVVLDAEQGRPLELSTGAADALGHALIGAAAIAWRGGV